MHHWKMMFAGLALMIFPYFVENMWILNEIGLFGSAALLFLRE